MRAARRAALVALLGSVVLGLGAMNASASARGNVTAVRGTSGEYGGPFSLTFSAGGTPTQAHGTFTYQEPQGYTVTGRVTCYYQEANRAVFTGPVTREMNPDNNTESFVVWVSDGGPAGQDAFDVAGGALLGPDCAQNFPLDRFDNEFVTPSLYYVTRGDIVVR